MNLVDSSAWIEYFIDGQHAQSFSRAVEQVQKLIVPTVVIYEVFKFLFREASEAQAWKAIAAMHLGKVVDLGVDTSLQAAQISLEFNLPMADSFILATAKEYKATLWTLDADFKGMEGVKYIT